MKNDVDNAVPVVAPPVKIVCKGTVLVASIAGAPKMSSADVNDLIRKLREGELDCGADPLVRADPPGPALLLPKN